MTFDRPPVPQTRTLLRLLAGVALIIEIVLVLVGGWIAAGIGLAGLIALGIGLAAYVAGAEVMDGQRSEVRRVGKEC